LCRLPPPSSFPLSFLNRLVSLARYSSSSVRFMRTWSSASVFSGHWFFLVPPAFTPFKLRSRPRVFPPHHRVCLAGRPPPLFFVPPPTPPYPAQQTARPPETILAYIILICKNGMPSRLPPVTSNFPLNFPLLTDRTGGDPFLCSGIVFFFFPPWQHDSVFNRSIPPRRAHRANCVF